MLRVVVTHVSLPYSSVGLATTLYNFIWVSLRVLFKCFLIVLHILWDLLILCVKIWFTSYKERSRDLWNTSRDIQTQTKLDQPS